MHLVINSSFYKSTFDSAKEKQKVELLIEQKWVYIPDVKSFFPQNCLFTAPSSLLNVTSC